MPYKKKIYKKGKRSKRSNGSSWYDRKYSTKDLAYKAYNGLKWIASRLNTEKKFFDASQTMNADDDGSSVLWLTNVLQGDTTSSRDGRQVRAVSLNLKLWCRLDGTVNSDTVRILILRNKQAAAPSIADVLTGPEIYAFRNLDNVRDIQVIRDMTFTLDADSLNQKLYNINIPLSHKVQWDIGTNTPAFGHLYIFAVGTIANASNTPTVITCESRFRYVDN